MIPQPDRITLIKSNGDEFTEIPAFVQSKVIFFNDGTLPIEEGDIIERILPNGLVEKYRVNDRGFHSMPSPHYQVKASKLSTTPQKEVMPATVVHQYYQYGNNSRMNVNSTDLSNNIVNKTELSEFEKIREIIINQIPDEQKRTRCLATLDDLKDSIGEKSYSEKYKRFIEVAADHISIIAPFIPYLTAYLA